MAIRGFGNPTIDKIWPRPPLHTSVVHVDLWRKRPWPGRERWPVGRDAHRTSMPSHGIPGTFKRLSSRMRAIEKNTFSVSATADPSRFPSRLLATRSIPNSPKTRSQFSWLSQFASVDTVNYLAQVSSILNGA